MKKEYIEKEIKSWLDEPDNEWDSIYNSGFSRGFRKAAEWRIASVWHDASVEPTEKKMLIVLDKSGYMFECDVLVDSIPDTTWEEISKDVEIVKWCYKEDLLPNKEEQ